MIPGSTENSPNSSDGTIPGSTPRASVKSPLRKRTTTSSSRSGSALNRKTTSSSKTGSNKTRRTFHSFAPTNISSVSGSTGTVVFIADFRADGDTEMAMQVLSEIVCTGDLTFCAFIAGGKNSAFQAALARGTLDMLGHQMVPVGLGLDTGTDDSLDIIRQQISEETTGINYVKGQLLTIERVLAAIGTDDEFITCLEARIFPSQALIQRILASNKTNAVTFVICSSCRGICELIKETDDLFFEKTERVVIACSASPESLVAAIEDDDDLIPVDSTDGINDVEALRELLPMLRDSAIPTVLFSAHATLQGLIKRNLYELMIRQPNPHPVACRVYAGQRAAMQNLWRSVHAGTAGRERNKEWFCRTYCGGEGLDRGPSDSIWDIVQSFRVHFPLVVLAMDASACEDYFDPVDTEEGDFEIIGVAVDDPGFIAGSEPIASSYVLDLAVKSSCRQPIGTDIKRPKDLDRLDLRAGFGTPVDTSNEDLVLIRARVVEVLEQEWYAIRGTNNWKERDRLIQKAGPSMKLLKWQTIDEKGRLPHWEDDATVSMAEAAYLANYMGKKLSIEMFSHRWHSPYSADSQMHSKASVMVEWGKQRWDAGILTVFWIDYACTNQDDFAQGVCMLPLYIAACNNLVCYDGCFATRAWCQVETLLFTALVCPSHDCVTPNFIYNPHADRLPTGELRPKREEASLLKDPGGGYLYCEDDHVIILEFKSICETLWKSHWKDSLHERVEDKFKLKGLNNLEFGTTEVHIRHHGKDQQKGQTCHQTSSGTSQSSMWHNASSMWHNASTSRSSMKTKRSTVTSRQSQVENQNMSSFRSLSLRMPRKSLIPARMQQALDNGSMHELRMVYQWGMHADGAVETRLLNQVRKKVKAKFSYGLTQSIAHENTDLLCEQMRDIESDPLLKALLPGELLTTARSIVARAFGHDWQAKRQTNKNQDIWFDFTHLQDDDVRIKPRNIPGVLQRTSDAVAIKSDDATTRTKVQKGSLITLDVPRSSGKMTGKGATKNETSIERVSAVSTTTTSGMMKAMTTVRFNLPGETPSQDDQRNPMHVPSSLFSSEESMDDSKDKRVSCSYSYGPVESSTEEPQEHFHEKRVVNGSNLLNPQATSHSPTRQEVEDPYPQIVQEPIQLSNVGTLLSDHGAEKSNRAEPCPNLNARLENIENALARLCVATSSVPAEPVAQLRGGTTPSSPTLHDSRNQTVPDQSDHHARSGAEWPNERIENHATAQREHSRCKSPKHRECVAVEKWIRNAVGRLRNRTLPSESIEAWQELEDRLVQDSIARLEELRYAVPSCQRSYENFSRTILPEYLPGRRDLYGMESRYAAGTNSPTWPDHAYHQDFGDIPCEPIQFPLSRNNSGLTLSDAPGDEYPTNRSWGTRTINLQSTAASLADVSPTRHRTNERNARRMRLGGASSRNVYSPIGLRPSSPDSRFNWEAEIGEFDRFTGTPISPRPGASRREIAAASQWLADALAT